MSRINYALLTFASSILLGVLMVVYLYNLDAYAFLYYGDAISHLVIARRTYDWVNPGIVQLGTVWLPITHILLIPVSTIEPLFRSGIGGAIIGVPSMTLTALLIYKITNDQLHSERLGLVAALLYITNVNVLYIASVAMMETPFMLFVVVTVYFFQRWYSRTTEERFKHKRDLLFTSLSIVGASLTRYEGWMFPLVMLAVIAGMITLKKEFRTTGGLALVLAAIVSLLGIAVWLRWNQVNFNDPLAFANLPYYSFAYQAMTRPFRQHLYLHPVNSARILFEGIKAMYGLPIIMVSLFGAATYLRKKDIAFGWKLFTIFLFSLPIIALYIAMVAGQGELGLHGNNQWFNGRYLIFIAPLFAFAGASLLTMSPRKLVILPLFFILITSYAYAGYTQPLATREPVAMKDAYAGFTWSQTGSSVKLAGVLKESYDDGAILLLTGSGQGQRIMMHSELSLRDFQDVAAGELWTASTKEPWSHVKWIVWSKNPDPDVTDLMKFWSANWNNILQHYEVVYDNEHYSLLKLKR